MRTTFDTMEMQAVTDLLREVANAEIRPRFGMLARHEIAQKSAVNDLVTIADLETEKALAQRLRQIFTGCAIIGEEAVAGDATLLDTIGDAELAFIIDPVDGTWNFAHGVPMFATMVAAVRRGETVAAWIHYPMSDDTLAAMRGSGAWRVDPTGQSMRCSVSTRTTTEGMSGFMALPLFEPAHRQSLALSQTRLGGVTSYFCSAYEYRMLVTGAKEFGLNGRLMPWDHAPGQLLHAEAGGHSALCDGRAYRPTLWEGPFLLAPDLESWNTLNALLARPN
ncbi:MAG: inositol monophosphatase family protein [Rhizobiaceae bacterium]